MIHASSLQEALDHQASGAVLFAGGTWAMRGPMDRPFVTLSGIPGLDLIEGQGGQLILGALVTHEALARALSTDPGRAALALAAGESATPAVRRMATLGGNICTADFASPDLVPALLVLGACVTIVTAQGVEDLPLADYLATPPGPHVLTHVKLPAVTGRSTHVRLMQRQAGEYPLAALSMALKADPDGTIRDLRIAVGAVEARPRRWPALEAALIGCTPDPAALRGIARDLSDFIGRDAVDAPGWYRTRVLPGLVARAFATLTAPEGR